LQLYSLVFSTLVAFATLHVKRSAFEDLRNMAVRRVPSDFPLTLHQLAVAYAYPAQFTVASEDTYRLIIMFLMLSGIIALLTPNSNFWRTAGNRVRRRQDHRFPLMCSYAIGIFVFIVSLALLVISVISSL